MTSQPLFEQPTLCAGVLLAVSGTDFAHVCFE